MENISREMEREIAQSKPQPYKQERKTRVIIVDDFGEMTSGEYLKTRIKILSVISIICFVTSVLFCYFYTGVSRDAAFTKNRLALVEKKVSEMIGEKEVLMARLVMSGKEPEMATKAAGVAEKSIDTQ